MAHRFQLSYIIRDLILVFCAFQTPNLISQEFFFPYTVEHFQNDFHLQSKVRSVCEVLSNDSVSDTTSVKYYDRDGWLLREDQFMLIPHGTKSWRSRKVAYVRDTNTIVRETHSAYERRKNDSAFRMHTKYIYVYIFNPRGLLECQYQLTPNEDTSAVTTYEYDEKGRCSGYIKRSGKRTFRYSFIYDGNYVHFIDSTFWGNNRSCCFNNKGQLLLDSGRREQIRYSYDDQNRLVRQEESVEEPQGPFEDRTIVFLYNGNSTLPVQSRIIFDGYELEFTERHFGSGLTEYSYSEEGFIIESRTGNYKRGYSYTFHLN